MERRATAFFKRLDRLFDDAVRELPFFDAEDFAPRELLDEETFRVEDFLAEDFRAEDLELDDRFEAGLEALA